MPRSILGGTPCRCKPIADTARGGNGVRVPVRLVDRMGFEGDPRREWCDSAIVGRWTDLSTKSVHQVRAFETAGSHVPAPFFAWCKQTGWQRSVSLWARFNVRVRFSRRPDLRLERQTASAFLGHMRRMQATPMGQRPAPLPFTKAVCVFLGDPAYRRQRSSQDSIGMITK